MTQHVIVVGAFPSSLINFRGELIRLMVARGHRVTAMAGEATAEDVARIEALGARFVPFPVQRAGMDPRADLHTLRTLRELFRTLQPDVILAYTMKPVVWGGLAARAVPKARFYALITGLGFALEGRGLRGSALALVMRTLLRAALARATGVIFQNEDDRNAIVAMGLVARDRTHRVNGSGVDCSMYGEQPLPGGAPVFLLIARLLRAKGLREFALAARRIRAERPDARFVVLGGADPSPDRVPLERVQAWEREGIIEFEGPVTDVRPALAGCHVYVLPSYREGMPRTVLEAMATGRPILTTDAPGCRDTVVEGENGFLVPPQDANALTERIRWFLEHEEEWPRMAAASRRLALERYEVGSVNRAMCDIMGIGAA